MAEFTDLKEAIKYTKVGMLDELVVPHSYVKFISLSKIEITIGYYRTSIDGIIEQKKIELQLPQYLLPIISRLFTQKSTTYSLLISLAHDLAVKCLNDIFSKYDSNIYILHTNGVLRCMVPEKYTFLPNEYILNGLINKDAETNIVNVLMCDQTRIMRMVYTSGDIIKTQAGKIKKAVAIVNSELGMLNYKTIKKSSVVAYPAIWYVDDKRCAILNGKGIPFVATNQIGRKRSDILLDFVVDIEMSKIYDVVVDIHEKMLQERPGDDITSILRTELRRIDPACYKTMQTSIDMMSVFMLYMGILQRSHVYAPQYRILIEKMCGKIYGGML